MGGITQSPDFPFQDPIGESFQDGYGSYAAFLVKISTDTSPLEADFTAIQTRGAAPFTVSFIDASTGVVTDYAWDFGDGQSSVEKSPAHTYTTVGSYDVSLTVTGPGGSSSKTSPGFIVVTETPVAADFTASPSGGPAPLQVTFTDTSSGTVTERLWDFGDGTASSEPTPVHTYENAGSYNVSLTVTGPAGSDVKTCEACITVTEPPPVADFIGEPTSGQAPLEVAFHDASAGNVDERLWDFGDGEASAETSPVHIYQANGTYTVSLTVSGPGGTRTETKENYITVGVLPLKADFTAWPTDEGAPQLVYFTDASTGAVVSREWSFGDGGTSFEQNPVHTYQNPGKYTVGLTVAGEGGETDTKTVVDCITLHLYPPTADLNGSPTIGPPPLEVAFRDRSMGMIDKYHWEFGDGGRSSEANPIHTYRKAGNYSVTHKVTGPGGSATRTAYCFISVCDPPKARCCADCNIGYAPFTVYFLNTSKGVSTDVQWSFGDGNAMSAGPRDIVENTYQSPGTYTIGIGVTGPGGSDSNDSCDRVLVLGPDSPLAVFTISSGIGPAPLEVTFTDESKGIVTTRKWDFGDGKRETTADRVITHTYKKKGLYTATLTAIGPEGSDTFTCDMCILVEKRKRR